MSERADASCNTTPELLNCLVYVYDLWDCKVSAQPLKFTQKKRPDPNHHVSVCCFCWASRMRLTLVLAHRLPEAVSNLAIQLYWKALISHT